MTISSRDSRVPNYMSNDASLAELLTPVEASVWGTQGWCLPGGGGKVFGGSILAHAIRVASLGAHKGGRVHALHAFFHHSGDVAEPVEYVAQTLHSTTRFSSRRVDCSQGARLVASATVSFHTPEQVHERGVRMSDVWLPPEECELANDRSAPLVEASIRLPFDVRTAVSREPGNAPGIPRLTFWVRAREPVLGWKGIQEAALAWASDFSLTRVAAADIETIAGPTLFASLNHSMWFHRPVRANDWHLYELESPVSRESLALSTGRFFTADGRLVATVNQECLVRHS